MPVVILAFVLVMLTVIAGIVIAVAWNRAPMMRWFAGLVVLVEAGAVIAAVRHVKASRADIDGGIALISAGRLTNKRTGGDPSTWYYATLEGIGELEVSLEQYRAMTLETSYTVSFSPRIRRAWTVDPS